MTDITPERMSEERLEELRGFACISYVKELLAHIAWQAGQNAELRQELTFREASRPATENARPR